tara:strand:- start:223 stop:750 length:528 start_codon:yes stop_codon:yes gene_type:complete
MDYKNGQIYCIRSYQTDHIYIGSTAQPLHKRFYQHKRFNGCSSECIMQYEDAYIELIENYPCNSKKELNRREGQHIRNTENCINKKIAGRTKKEYQKIYETENREIINEKQKIYRNNNKDIVSEKRQIHYEINKEKLLEQQKEYRLANKEKVNENQRQYRLKKKFETTIIKPSTT